MSIGNGTKIIYQFRQTLPYIVCVLKIKQHMNIVDDVLNITLNSTLTFDTISDSFLKMPSVLIWQIIYIYITIYSI